MNKNDLHAMKVMKDKGQNMQWLNVCESKPDNLVTRQFEPGALVTSN